MIGQTLNKRYRITALLGEGAMGEVYRATDTHTRQDVAIKVISQKLAADVEILERFRREGEALRQLRHANTVAFVDMFPLGRQYVIVMEYVPGGSLHSLIKRGPLPVDRAVRIALELSDALARAHHINIVHRDIKPDNVLIAPDGTPKLTDFGVARLLGEKARLTGTGTQIGTPYYMSPEAWEGRPLDPQADIWSLGVMLYEMLTGQVPFGGDTLVAVMNKVLTAPLPDIQALRSEISPVLAEIIQRMLMRDKAERYRTMRQVAVDLEEVEEEARHVQAEARRKQEEETRRAQEVRLKAEEGQKARALQVQAEARSKQEEEARRAQEARLKAEEEQKARALRAQEEIRRKQEEEQKAKALRAQEEARRKTEEEQKAKALQAQEEARRKTEEEQKAKALQAQNEAKRKAEEEQRIREQQAQEEARRKTEEEQKAKALLAQEKARRKAEEKQKAKVLQAQRQAEDALRTEIVAPATIEEAPRAKAKVAVPGRVLARGGAAALAVVCLLIAGGLGLWAAAGKFQQAASSTATSPAQFTATALLPGSTPPSTVTPTPPTSTPRPSDTSLLTDTLTPVPPTAAPTLGIGSTMVSNIDGMALVYVPAGEFLMGSTAADSNADSSEKPQHTVYLDAYWIDKTEVTNAMFAKFVAGTGYKTDAEKAGSGWAYNPSSGWNDTKGADWRHPLGPVSNISTLDNHPVVQMSWNDAKAYCEWAGRRLPTEAEWEKAARGMDGRLYPWGNQDPSPTLANYNMNVKDTTEVGKYPAGASPYGALDMAGNVWEWVADWINDTYYSSSPSRNPTGPTSGQYRVLRGGAWYYAAGNVRAAIRLRNLPIFRDGDGGFRCVRSPAANDTSNATPLPPSLAATLTPAPPATSARTPVPLVSPSPSPTAPAPTPAPAGKWVVSVREELGVIYANYSDGSEMRLADNGKWPVLSPDGTKIVFLRPNYANEALYIVNSDGSGLIKLANTPGQNNPWTVWSPDSQKIYYQHRGVCVVNADGSGQTTLAEGDFILFWLGGSKIFFYKNQGIYLMNADGSGQTEEISGVECGAMSAKYCFKPCSLPDQRAVWGVDVGNHEIYIVNPDGSGATNLTNSPATEDLVGCLADGRITFRSDRDGPFKTYVMNADGSSVQLYTP